MIGAYRFWALTGCRR